MWEVGVFRKNEAFLRSVMPYSPEDSIGVSVCMITYKHANFVIEAIEGVLRQKTDFRVELLISNDNSPDDTDSIVRDYIRNRRLPENIEIRYFLQNPNLGMARNFLWALDNCRGKYIALCEGDDFWRDSLKLQKQRDFLERSPDFILSFHDSDIVGEDNSLIRAVYLEDFNKRDIGFQEFSTGEYVLPTQSVFFRNIGMGFLPTSFLSVMNTDTFLYAMLSSKGKFHYHDDILKSAYRKHDHGVWTSRNSFQKSLSGLDTFLKLKEVFPANKNLDGKIGTLRIQLVFYCFKSKRWNLFFKHYFKTLMVSFSDLPMLTKFVRFHKQVLFNRFSRVG